MGCKNNCGFAACSGLGVLLSIIFGAIIGILFAFGSIPFIDVSIVIALVFGFVALGFLVFAAVTATNGRSCGLIRAICENGTCLLVGALGIILTAIAALSIALVATVIASIALVAIGAFFFALTFIALIAFIIDILCEVCCRRRDD